MRNQITNVGLIAGLMLLVYVGTANALSDPTQPADYSPSGTGGGGVVTERPQGPVLQSTFVAPGRKRAVIDGKAVGVGDKIHDARVVDIRPYEVVLRQGDRQTSLRLMPQLIKQQKVASQ